MELKKVVVELIARADAAEAEAEAERDIKMITFIKPRSLRGVEAAFHCFQKYAPEEGCDVYKLTVETEDGSLYERMYCLSRGYTPPVGEDFEFLFK